MSLQINVNHLTLSIKAEDGEIYCLVSLPNTTDRVRFIREFKDWISDHPKLRRILKNAYGSVQVAFSEIFDMFLSGGAAKSVSVLEMIMGVEGRYRSFTDHLDVVEVRDGSVFLTDGRNVVRDNQRGQIYYEVY